MTIVKVTEEKVTGTLFPKMAAPQTAPVLSTPSEQILEGVVAPSLPSTLSEEQLYLQYEIQRTIAEIRQGKWKRIALQFPDSMLVDAPRVFERLRDGLRSARLQDPPLEEALSEKLSLEENSLPDEHAAEESLCILADTSYGACCVDEIAAEHCSAEVVVHYGRSCLSPTARLPVIYVFTSAPLDLIRAVENFTETFPDKETKVCLMADIPYAHQIPALYDILSSERGYTNLFATEILHNPGSLLPNRSVPGDAELLKTYSIFHIGIPPISLLLTLASRIASMHIYSDPSTSSHDAPPTQAETRRLLSRRYGLTTRLASVPVFGILINTLSVANYLDALTYCQQLIEKKGKKSYVFVVGKVNAAKLANFSEIGGWVVIGCWESSLLESRDFWKPVITPFELGVALQSDSERVWGGEWIGDFGSLLGKHQIEEDINAEEDDGDDDEDAPPEFDLRTGKLISNSRPMGRPKRVVNGEATGSGTRGDAAPSSALVQRAKQELATINGQISPAAEYLRTKRTWQGLGSDHAIAYERDDEGNITGAAMEEGRGGIAKGYAIGGGREGRT